MELVDKINSVAPQDNIYVLSYNTDSGKVYKVGYSRSIINRLFQYYNTAPVFNIEFTGKFTSASKLEQYIHGSYKSCLRREWYDEETYHSKIKPILYGDVVVDLESFYKKREEVEKIKNTRKNNRYVTRKKERLVESHTFKSNEIFSKVGNNFIYNPKYNLSTKDKRRLVAIEVSKKRRYDNNAAIDDVIKSWDFKKRGKITIKSLSEAVNLSFNTVARRYKDLKEKIKQKNLDYKKNNY